MVILVAHVSTAEHFAPHWLLGGAAADNHGQQARAEETNRSRPTSPTAGVRLPSLQLSASGGGGELVVVSDGFL